MKLSFRFFYTKINRLYPETSMILLGDEMPMFSTLGILSEDSEVSDEIIYIDLFSHTEPVPCDSISIITTESRAESYKDCNLIIVPSEVHLPKIVQLISHTFTYYFGWSDALYEAIAKNMDLQTIIDLTAPILKNPIYFADTSFKMLASWGGEINEVSATWRYQEKYRYQPYLVMQNLIDSGELKKIFNTPQAWLVENSAGFPQLPFISKTISKEGIHYGNFFIIKFYNQLDACDLEIADYLGMVLSTALYGNENYLEMSTFYHAHFLEDLIEGTMTDRRIMTDQLRALRWEVEGDYQLAIFDTSGDNDAIRHHMMALLSSDLGAQCLGYKGDVLVVFNCKDKRMDRIITQLRQISRDFNRTVAISERFIDFSSIGKYYEQAQFTLDTADIKAARGQLLSYDDVFFDHIAMQVGDNIPVCAHVIKLSNHDNTHGTEYCHTLLTWLMNDRNIGVTAEELFIHRNTLTNRLERINSIIDEDLNDFNIRVRLILSLYVILRDAKVER